MDELNPLVDYTEIHFSLRKLIRNRELHHAGSWNYRIVDRIVFRMGAQEVLNLCIITPDFDTYTDHVHILDYIYEMGGSTVTFLNYSTTLKSGNRRVLPWVLEKMRVDDPQFYFSDAEIYKLFSDLINNVPMIGKPKDLTYLLSVFNHPSLEVIQLLIGYASLHSKEIIFRILENFLPTGYLIYRDSSVLYNFILENPIKYRFIGDR
jgi:hypothetical protein